LVRFKDAFFERLPNGEASFNSTLVRFKAGRDAY